MDSSSNTDSKMSKLENLLTIVNNEVDSVIILLKNFKQHSVELVETLRNIPSSSIFLKEYVKMNSFLLKYLDYLTEMSCKFEVLEIPDKTENNFLNFSATNEDLSISKTESCVNLKENAVSSTISHKSIALDYLSDTSESAGTSGDKKSIGKSKSKKAKKAEKKVLLAKKDKENKSPDVNLHNNSLSGANGVSEETKKSRNRQESSIYPIKENEREVSSPNSYVNEKLCSPVKEINKDTFCKAESEIFPGTEDVCQKLPVSQKNLKFGNITNSNSVLTNNSNSVSPMLVSGCNDKLFEIKPINISRKLGEEYKVIVEHVVSPSEFYVYICESQLNLFKKLDKELQLIQRDQSFHNKKESKYNLSQVMGKYALYYSKCDEKWCRAKVTDWRLNHKDDLIHIFLLDYGESKCVTLSDIQPMPDCFKNHPAFIQRCHLSGIYPIEGNLSSKSFSWGKAAIEKMKCLVDTSMELLLIIMPEDSYHPARSLPVTLWLGDQNDCVNDLLVQSQYAQAIKKPENSKENLSEREQLEKWNPMKEDFESYLNSYDLDMEDPAAVIYGYVGKDYERICKHFAKTGKCFKGLSCKKEHVPLDPSGFTTDKEEVYKNAVNALPTPSHGSIIIGQVTCVLGINLFYCIRDSSAWTSEEETLESLVNYMNSNENIREMKKLLIPPSVGQIVIGQYSVDGSWYRGKIIESQPESDHYVVFFVDYGNKEALPLSCIRAIEGRYLHLPFQAIQCFIYGITNNPKIPTKEAVEYVTVKLTEGPIHLKVISTHPGDHPRLLVHVYDQKGNNIGKELVNKNYAKLKEELLVNSESTTIPG